MTGYKRARNHVLPMVKIVLQVGYATAMDIYIIICFFAVFAALVEFACINFIDTFIKRFKAWEEEEKKRLDKEKEEEEKRRCIIETLESFRNPPLGRQCSPVSFS